MSKLTLNQVNKLTSLFPTEKIKHTVDVNGEKITIEFKPYLTLVETSTIVDNTVNACFSSEGFAPEYRDVIFFKNVIEVMTNLPLPMMNSGDLDEHNKPKKIVDLAELHRWNEMIDLNPILEKYSQLRYLFDKLISLIDEKLEFQKSLICHPDRDGEIIEAIVGFVNNLNSIVTKYADNLDNVDLQKLAPAIMELSKNKLDEEAIKTILKVGSASKVGSENVPNLEVVK